MGIKQLTKLLSEHAPAAIKEQCMGDYNGRKLAIDASSECWPSLRALLCLLLCCPGLPVPHSPSPPPPFVLLPLSPPLAWAVAIYQFLVSRETLHRAPPCLLPPTAACRSSSSAVRATHAAAPPPLPPPSSLSSPRWLCAPLMALAPLSSS
jgi:hypothetical protein